MPLSTQTIPPSPNSPHTHTVIFLHGRGDTASNFRFAFTQWQDASSTQPPRNLADMFPSVRWVFPQSEIRPLARHPGSRISQWFDTWDIANLSEKEELQVEGLRESVGSIREILEEEVKQLGGRWGNVVLAGISQGGATVVHTLINLRTKEKGKSGLGLGGLMVFSGRMPFPGRSLKETRRVLGLLEGDDEEDELEEDEVVKATPALVQHCADDDLSRVENGRAVRDSLQRFGVDVTWREYPTGGHWLHSPEGIEDTARWLREHVFTSRV